MFDMGQVHIVGEKPETYFELLGEDIVHIHFVDGTPGGHLALGDGTLDLTGALACIERAGYTGNLSLEIADRRYFMDPRAADEQSLRWLKTNQKGDGTR
jgi:protein FrlC